MKSDIKDNKNQTPNKIEELKKPVVIDSSLLNGSTYVDAIEKKRVDIVKSAKKSQRMSTLSTAVTFVLVALAIVFNYAFSLKAVAIGVAIFAVIELIVSSILLKRVFKPDNDTYIHDILIDLDAFIFDDPAFKDVTFYPVNECKISDFQNNGIYKDVNDFIARNQVNGYFMNHSFKSNELALFDAQKNKSKKTHFVGKYLSMTNSLKGFDRLVLVKKGEKDIDAYNDIDDLTILLEEDSFLIYGPKDFAYTSVLKADFINAFKDFAINNTLLKVTLVIKPGLSQIFFSYEDSVMTLPYFKKLNEEAIQQYKADFMKALRLLVTIIED